MFFSQFDPRLAPLLQKSPSWYMSLAKVLQNKYGEFSRQFSSEDGQVSRECAVNNLERNSKAANPQSQYRLQWNMPLLS